jgi:hypothetical protein
MVGETQRLAAAGRKGTRRSRRTREHDSHGDRERDHAQEPKTHRFLLWRGDIAAQILTANALHSKRLKQSECRSRRDDVAHSG